MAGAVRARLDEQILDDHLNNRCCWHAGLAPGRGTASALTLRSTPQNCGPGPRDQGRRQRKCGSSWKRRHRREGGDIRSRGFADVNLPQPRLSKLKQKDQLTRHRRGPAEFSRPSGPRAAVAIPQWSGLSLGARSRGRPAMLALGVAIARGHGEAPGDLMPGASLFAGSVSRRPRHRQRCTPAARPQGR